MTKGCVASFQWEQPLFYMTDRPGEFLTAAAKIMGKRNTVQFGFRAQAHPAGDTTLYSCELTGNVYLETGKPDWELFKELDVLFLSLDPSLDTAREQAKECIEALTGIKLPEHELTRWSWTLPEIRIK